MSISLYSYAVSVNTIMTYPLQPKPRRIFSSASNNYKRLFPFVIIFVVVGSVVLYNSLAAPLGLYVTPSSTQVVVGNTFSISVRANTGSSSSSITTNILYDPAYIQYTGSDSATSAFPLQTELNTTKNSISITRSSDTPVTGDVLVASLTFKTLKPIGQTLITTSGSAKSNANTSQQLASTTTMVEVMNSTEPAPSRASDTTSPSVNILNPSENDSVTGNFTISAVGIDNTSVSRMEIYIDGTVLSAENDDSITATFDMGNDTVDRGQHTIEIKAYDRSNNSGTSIVHVTKP